MHGHIVISYLILYSYLSTVLGSMMFCLQELEICFKVIFGVFISQTEFILTLENLENRPFYEKSSKTWNSQGIFL